MSAKPGRPVANEVRDEGEARGDTHSVSDQVREDAGRRVGRRSAGAPLAAGGLLSGGQIN